MKRTALPDLTTSSRSLIPLLPLPCLSRTSNTIFILSRTPHLMHLERPNMNSCTQEHKGWRVRRLRVPGRVAIQRAPVFTSARTPKSTSPDLSLSKASNTSSTTGLLRNCGKASINAPGRRQPSQTIHSRNPWRVTTNAHSHTQHEACASCPPYPQTVCGSMLRCDRQRGW